MDPNVLNLVQAETGPVLIITAPGSLARYYGAGYELVGGKIRPKPPPPNPGFSIPAPTSGGVVLSSSGEWFHFPLTVPIIHQSKRIKIRWASVHFSTFNNATIRELQLWDGETLIETPTFDEDKRKINPDVDGGNVFREISSKESPWWVNKCLTVSLLVSAVSGSVSISSVDVWLVGE